MARISRVEQISADRYVVTPEQGEPFPLRKRDLAQYGIWEGASLSDEVLHEIREEVLFRRACAKAMDLLARGDLTESQLRRKLGQAHYPESLLERAVAYVKEFHYLDDVRYAWNYIDLHKDACSRPQLAAKLRERGISAEDIQRALDETEFPDEQEQIRYWMRKRHFLPGEADEAQTRKFCQFLMRKGFSPSAVRRLCARQE